MTTTTHNTQVNIKETGAKVVSRNVKDIGAASKKSGSQVGALVKRLGAFATAGSAILLVRKGLHAIGEQERVVNLVNAALAATGNQLGISAGHLAEFADEFERVTLFAAEEVQDLQASLIRFTNIGGEVFNRSTAAILDFAAAMGQTAVGASSLLGRALDDPKNNLTLLERQVGKFTDAEKEMIDVLSDAGRIAEVQEIILAKLESRFKGTAKELTKGLSGAYKQFKNELEGAIKLTVSAGQATGEMETETGRLQVSIIHATEFLRGYNAIVGKNLVESFRDAGDASETFYSKLGGATSAFLNIFIGLGKGFADFVGEAARGVGIIDDFFSKGIQKGFEFAHIVEKPFVIDLDFQEATRKSEELGSKLTAIQSALSLLRGVTTIDEFIPGFKPVDAQKIVSDGAELEVVRANNALRELIKSLTDTSVSIKDTELSFKVLEFASEGAREANERLNAELKKAQSAAAKAAIDEIDESLREMTESLEFQIQAFGLSGIALAKVQITYGRLAKASQSAKDEFILMAEAFERQKSLIEFSDAVNKSFQDTFFNFVTGAASATDALKSFVNSAIADLIKLSIAESGIGKGVGGFFGDVFSRIFGAKDGAVISGGTVEKFQSGGVVDQPTLFNTKTGFGVAGEAGAEAILPLRRSSSGVLGVVSSGDGRPSNVTISPVVNVNVTTSREEGAESGRVIADKVVIAIKGIIVDEIVGMKRPGGLLEHG